MLPEEVAQVAYAADRMFRSLRGEETPSWQDLPAVKRAQLVDVVRQIAAGDLAHLTMGLTALPNVNRHKRLRLTAGVVAALA